jgi:hypothetical protein
VFTNGLLPLLLILSLIPVTWLLTRFHKPKNIFAKFIGARREAGIATALVITALSVLAAAFFFWSQNIGHPIGTTDTYNPSNVLFEWGIYALMSFIPIFVLLRLRHQSFESVGLTKKIGDFQLA